MPGRHLPPDHSKGDANTLGGYMAVHDRPAAFAGADGFSYSVEILADATGETERPFGAYLLFVRWARIGATSPAGHVESEFVAYGATPDEALRAAGALALGAVKEVLDRLIAASPTGAPGRRWWDAMRAPDVDEADAKNVSEADARDVGEADARDRGDGE
ncbi:MAG: hypothetical protein ABR499_06125 [Gemmatimonadaceae bacterium]